MTSRIITNAISAAVAVASIVAIAGGTAAAAPPNGPLPASVKIHEITLTANDVFHQKNSVFYEGRVNCPGQYPYLVLDSVGDNSSRFFRSATYHTGDNKSLVRAPLVAEYVTPVQSHSPHYNAADVRFQIVRNSFGHPGHEKLTLFCAATAAEAHQQ
ncbi:hypothetical protein LQL77_30240 [Rhodococcus cerastii]|nr:hypothetical protein [Rhodococcus cerastii]